MRRRAFGFARRRVAARGWVVVGAMAGLLSCGGSPSTDAEPRGVAVGGLDEATQAGSDETPDARLITHAFEPSTPTPAGLAYVEFVADVHERADLADDTQTRAEILADGLERAAPEGLAEAEVLRLELAARLGELHLELDDADAAQRAIAPLVPTSRSLPLDRASAHALTVLGDAAHQRGEDALAAGSYARAVRMMSLLADDLAERAGVTDSPAPTDPTDPTDPSEATEGGTP